MNSCIKRETIDAKTMVEVLTIEPNGTRGQLSLEGEPTREGDQHKTVSPVVGVVLVGRECSQSVDVNSSSGSSRIRKH